MIKFLRRAAGDRKGASAIEFALIFPVIFVLHIAAVEALQVYEAQRNVAHIAATMADITAQNRSVTTDELNDILAASVSMMHPFPNVNLQQRVSSMSANASGSVSLDWSVKKDFTSSDAPSIPAGYLQANESVIVTDVIYDYEPTFNLIFSGPVRMSHKAYVRPRLSTKVEKAS